MHSFGTNLHICKLAKEAALENKKQSSMDRTKQGGALIEQDGDGERVSGDLLQVSGVRSPQDHSMNKSAGGDHTIMHTKSYSYDRFLSDLDTTVVEYASPDRIRGKGWFRLKMVIISVIGGLALAVAGDLVSLQ